MERNGKKTGTGKKLERNAFFPFPFLHFLMTFFSRFWRKSSRTGEKRAGTVKKTVERCGTAKNGRSTPFQIVEFGAIPFFCRLKPVSAPVPTRFFPVPTRFYPVPNPFLPLSTPVFFPFLYCLAIISRCTLVAAQPLDHVGPSLVRWTSGRFVFMVRRR